MRSLLNDSFLRKLIQRKRFLRFQKDRPSFGSRNYRTHLRHVLCEIVHIERPDFVIATVIFENVIAVPAGHQEARHHQSVPSIVHHLLEHRILAGLTSIDKLKQIEISRVILDKVESYKRLDHASLTDVGFNSRSPIFRRSRSREEARRFLPDFNVDRGTRFIGHSVSHL